MTNQMNMRVPEHARDLMRRIARMLRDNPELAVDLSSFLDERDGGRMVAGTVAARLADIEARLEAMETGKAARPAGMPRLVTGTGKGRRLTEAGEEEVRRRLDAGQQDSVIAKALDIHPNTVAGRRRIRDRQRP